MAFTVNTNTLSQTAQQNLQQSQDMLNTSIERLSSGSRINSAKDDAAGQAIANRMTAQINGLDQASRNANDGISLAQTAEGALDQVNDNLQRIRELSVQAENGTNSQSDLNSIQDEIGQRLSEIDRVSEQTEFNGTNVLNGSQSTISVQVGADDGQTIDINLDRTNSSSLSLSGFNINGFADAAGDGNTAATVNDDDGNDVVANGTVTLTDQNGDAFTGTLVEDDNGALFAENGSGDTFAIESSSVTTGTAGDGSDSTIEATVDTSRVLSARSEGPMASLDSAIQQVDASRSGLGAVQNRLDSAIQNIETTSINTSAARSQIEDTDYAAEVSQRSQAQILQQAGTAVLAQANQSNQGVLSLLG